MVEQSYRKTLRIAKVLRFWGGGRANKLGCSWYRTQQAKGTNKVGDFDNVLWRLALRDLHIPSPQRNVGRVYVPPVRLRMWV